MCNAVFTGIENELILTHEYELTFEIGCHGLVMTENVWGNSECFRVAESLGQDEQEQETSTRGMSSIPPAAYMCMYMKLIKWTNVLMGWLIE